ncbi:hypothetical protein IU486_20570 [Streptomyces gardneri]|uniref:hypothetical protein n=1 Tax=Nocardia TaxID=1817 RepID=UPI0013597F5F|nr:MULTISPECIES: hypothetical protein [Nocardia]MBF6167125.1 hypothetical protein [Streptomyces gardneri]MBF6204171.1 hypothetical protein [Streptomyces gardneri]UAK30624.1 hypothetical protein K8O92_22305 [Nocardia asteroides]
MLIATLIITTTAVVRRWFARRSPGGDFAGRTASGPVRRALHRPAPVAAALVALLGIAVAAGTLSQC